MIFEGLSNRLQETLNSLRGKGTITEKDVNKAMREVKLSLLEADVDYKVVKDFVKTVKERCIGQDVLKSLTPGQQVIKIVNEELQKLMGDVQSKINFSSNPPTIIMMVGLQGAGKTTTCGKLANNIMKYGKTPMLVACDVYRPAAIDQLEILSEKIGAKFYSEKNNEDPIVISKNAVDNAKTLGFDTVIVDTAGRLHIDEELMNELIDIKNTIKPHEILLVVDSMTGQDTVNIVNSFSEKLGIDGVILTKLDGDTRGGAALSIRAATKKPIKYIAVGEKMEDLEAFHPDRIANRILGMGDVLSLIEKAQDSIEVEDSKKLESKLKNMDFDFDDFLTQMQQVKKMGPLKNIVELIPGFSQAKQLKNVDFDDKRLVGVEAIIQSMTKDERKNPDIINGSRKKRIANGSGTKVSDVNRLIKQFKDTKKLMKRFSKMSGGKKKGLFPFGF